MNPSFRIVFTALVLLLPVSRAFANGALVVDAGKNTCVPMVATAVVVHVEDQVAVVTTTQTFRNTLGRTVSVMYAFPLPEGASATRLRWFNKGQWWTASFETRPDSVGTPGTPDYMHKNLKTWLGPAPLTMTFDSLLRINENLTVELTYVQLLPYKNGFVSYTYPNDYTLIQNSSIAEQTFVFELHSSRTIEAMTLTSHTPTADSTEGTHAMVATATSNAPCKTNYTVQYRLSLAKLGMFGYSTKRDSTHGAFTFIVEPDPSTTDIVKKNFCLIIDRSGSMSTANKMQQAIDAACFIVENLNPGDMFNLVEYNSYVSSFKTGLTSYTPTSKVAAIAWLCNLQASGSTNIEGALTTAIQQFSNVPQENANIIIFLTDGQPTVGLTDRGAIVSSVRGRIAQTGRRITLFTFGIGTDVDRLLLEQLAAQNSGIAEMLGTDAVRSRISDFYTTIRNPVLIDPHVEFSSTRVTDVYPATLPNLYKGQQMIITGRYELPLPMVTATFSGTAFGQPVVYTYDMSLADTVAPTYLFIPKLWAKMAIDHLLGIYNGLDPESDRAKEFKAEIIRISLAYGVISPFTSFSSTPTDVEAPDAAPPAAVEGFRLLGNHPNPFNPGTTIRFHVDTPLHRSVTIRIHDAMGRLLRVLAVDVTFAGDYQVWWDGLDSEGRALPSGTYVYVVDFGGTTLSGRMQMLR